MKRREIKFRAWDGKQMIEVGVLCMEDNRAMDYYNFYDGYAGEEVFYGESDGVMGGGVLMQYVGLRDKNEKPIYEGDIVTLIEANRNYTIEYLEYGFKLVYAEPKFNRMNWGLINRVEELDFTIEVIGNIYENPELLSP